MAVNAPTLTPSNLGPEFDVGNVTPSKVTLLQATTTLAGKARLATATDVSSGTVGAVVDANQLKSQLSGFVGALNYQGSWNPATQTPQLLSGVGTKGYAYKLSTAGVSVATTASAASSSSTSLSVTSGTGIVAGQLVTGTGVPSSTYVQSISGTTVTLTQAASVANAAALTFATYLDGAGPFYAGDTVVFDGTTYDKYDGAAETSINVTDAFGVHLYYAAP